MATVPRGRGVRNVQVALANNSIGPHVLIAAGGLPRELPSSSSSRSSTRTRQDPRRLSSTPGPFSRNLGQDHQKIFDLTTPGQAPGVLPPDRHSHWHSALQAGLRRALPCSRSCSVARSGFPAYPQCGVATLGFSSAHPPRARTGVRREHAGPGEATIRPSELPILGCWSTRRHPIDISAPIHSVSRDRKGAAAVDAVGEVERNPETARPK